MIIDITHWDPKKLTDAFVWMDMHIAKPTAKPAIDDIVVLSADLWRVYKKQCDTDGFVETVWFLEFDRDTDASLFLLKWS